MTQRKSATKAVRESAARSHPDPATDGGYEARPRRTAGIRELRDHLSEYLGDVKQGGTVLVTEHGRPIASIVPMGVTPELQALADSGFIVLPTRPKGDPEDWPRIRVDRDSSDLVDWAKGGPLR